MGIVVDAQQENKAFAIPLTKVTGPPPLVWGGVVVRRGGCQLREDGALGEKSNLDTKLHPLLVQQQLKSVRVGSMTHAQSVEEDRAAANRHTPGDEIEPCPGSRELEKRAWMGRT
ncbi:hypothetical protein TNCV_3261701 [Trichonephila clavipes]|nr:hypothetical protein TNCV_3261701 [Trichonephila clavipes]